MKVPNTAHSIRDRLLKYAKANQQSFDLVLLRYANERLLYRLGQSPYVDRFLLKGATLFLVWNESQPHRPTRDVDLLSIQTENADELGEMFRLVCNLSDSDGVQFKADSVLVSPIREEQRYGGRRITLQAELHGARISLQVDVGFGDAVTPAADWIEVPGVLTGLDRPRLRAYPVYTVVAEKLEAMVQLGSTNSRMKDFYDLEFLFSRFSFDQDILRQAIRRTFSRRQTALPSAEETLFGPEFIGEKAPLWQQFLRRNQLVAPTRSWEEILSHLQDEVRSLLQS